MHESREVVCPNPMPWARLYERMLRYAKRNGIAEEVPKPLILSAWWHTSDADKRMRWRDMQQWAERHGCLELLGELNPEDLYRAKS